MIAALLAEEASGRDHYWWPADTPEDGVSTYRWRAAFWLKVARGAECIARLGAARCLACGQPLPEPRRENLGGRHTTTERVLYCCDIRAGEAIADRDAVLEVFKLVERTLPPPDVTLIAPDGEPVEVDADRVDRLLSRGYKRA